MKEWFMEEFYEPMTPRERAQAEEAAFVADAQALQQQDIDEYWASEAGNDALVEQREAEANHHGW